MTKRERRRQKVHDRAYVAAMAKRTDVSEQVCGYHREYLRRAWRAGWREGERRR